MASLVPTAFDGLTLGYSGDYGALFEADGDYTVEVTINQQARPGTYPAVTGHARNAITRRMLVYRPHNSSVSAATFNATVKQRFDPARNSDGPRYLTGTGDDGVTVLRLPCYVQALRQRPGVLHAYDVTLESVQPYFETNAAPTPSAANPASVTNSGTTDALPSIALTTTTHVSRAKVSFGTAVGERGRAAVPTQLSGTFTGATAATTLAFVNGVSVPTRFISTSDIWVVIDVPGNGGSVTVDILWGAGINNPRADELANSGDFDWTNSNNASWRVSAYSVTDNPVRAGEWRPATFGRLVPDGSSYELDDSAGTSVVLKRYIDGRGRNDADSIAMSIPQTTGISISNLSRVTATHDASCQSFVATRAKGSNAWVDAWTTSANATVTTSITIPTGAVEIAAGTRYIGATPATNPTLTISGATAVAVDLIGLRVTAATEVMDFYDGTITIGDDTITVDEVIVLDGTLTLDAATGQITSSTGESYYGSIRGSDPSALVRLEPGANAISDTLDVGASYTISHRDSFG